MITAQRGLSGTAFNLLLSCLLWGTAPWILIFSIPMDAASKKPGCFVQNLQSVIPLTCGFVPTRSWGIWAASDPGHGLPGEREQEGIHTYVCGHRKGEVPCTILPYHALLHYFMLRSHCKWLTIPIHLFSPYPFTFRTFTFKYVFLQKLYRKATLDRKKKKKKSLKCIFHALSYSIDFVFLIFSYKEKVF